MNQKQIKVVVIIVVLIGAVALGGKMIHDHNVKARYVAMQKKADEARAAYEKEKSEANQAVNTAYDSRKDSDIKIAQAKIDKLESVDKDALSDKLMDLQNLLSQVKEANKLISEAEKNIGAGPIGNAQMVVDAETSSYLAKDKKEQQARLDKLKKIMADNEAKQAAKDKAALQETQASLEAAKKAQESQAAKDTSEVQSKLDDLNKILNGNGN